MKLKQTALAILAGAGVLLGLAEPSPAQELKLGELIQEALANNPELKARAQELSAASEHVPQAGALPDPMLSLGVMSVPVDTLALNREPMTQTQVGVSQAFPFPGKRPLLIEAARAQRDAAAAKQEAARNRVAREVREAYLELYYLDHALEVTRRNQELLKQYVQVAGAMYAVGKGLQQDVLKAQVELSMLLDQEIRLTQEREMAAANLNRLLGRDPGQPLGPARTFELEPLPADAQKLADRAAAQSPELALADRMATESQALEKLARRSFYPDFAVMASYGFREDLEMGGKIVRQPDLVSGSVGFNLPLYSYRKQSREVAESQARFQARQYEREDTALRVREEVRSLYARAQQAWQEIQIYQAGIIPQSENSLQAALAGYQVNKVDFLTLLDNQKTLYDLEIKLRRLQADYGQAYARLDELCGGAGLKPVTLEK